MKFFRRAPRTSLDRPLLDVDQFTVSSRRANMEAIRARATSAYVGGGTALCRVLGRYKMYVDARDVGLASHLMMDGYWELWVTEFLIGVLKPGMVAVDVGANVGYYTLIMADKVGAAGKVHAFEPNPPIARLLDQNAHVNGFRERTTIHVAALGEADDARFTLHVPEHYPGGAALRPAPDPLPDESALLTMRRLDSFPELLDADVIKIDAEGAEEAIWKGMTAILARGRPMTILLEFVRGRYADPRAFIDDLIAQGFSLNYVDIGVSMRPISPDAVLRWPEQDDIMLVLIR